MKTLFKWFLLAGFMGLVLLPAAIVLLSIEKQPTITQKTALSLENIQQVKWIIQRNRPDSIQQKQLKDMILSEKELNLLVGYGLSSGIGLSHVGSQVTLSPGLLTAQVSLEIPSTPLGNYINLAVTLEEKQGSLKLHSLEAGRISLPGSNVLPLLAYGHRILMLMESYKTLSQALEAIKQVRIDGRYISLSYAWDPTQNLQAQIKNSLVSPDHQARLVRHHNELARLSTQAQGKSVSLANFLQPMFAFAALESQAGGNPVQENRALFQVLALVVTGQNLGSYINPELKKELARFRPARLLLRQRKDLTQHFLVSAALTVSASSHLANFLGIAKEMDDANHGTGFSFADLAADKAGVKIGEMAIANPTMARQLQERMQTIAHEDGFMPSISQLPEGIMALEFKVRYQDLDSAAYALVNSEIDQRLKNCLVFQN